MPVNGQPIATQVASARAYESLLVPALFGQWASPVLDAAQVSAGTRVLDVGCGTGVLARAALRRTGAEGYVAGLDPNLGMLAVARELASSVDWRPGQAEAIPFPNASFDVVACQFGLMFMDRIAAAREMLRVLRPDGRLIVAVWDAFPNIPAYAAEISLLERFGGTAAADALRAPFGLGDQRLLASILREAGAGSVTIGTSNGVARFPGLRVMVEADLRGWLPAMGVPLSEERIEQILEEAEAGLAEHVAEDGRVTFEISAHIATATKS